jgi:hypothetical protein
MSEDWMDITEDSKSALPVPVELPLDPAARVALAEECWAKLTMKQKAFLTGFRNNRLNARRTERKTGISRSLHKSALRDNVHYATIVKLWMGLAGTEALDRDRLLARQDDIVETLLTPKPILFQGHATGHMEVEASAASRANETLMKAAGLLKDKELEVNLGIIGPALNIQVVQNDGTIQELASTGVAVELPEAIEAEWMELPADGS